MNTAVLAMSLMTSRATCRPVHLSWLGNTHIHTQTLRAMGLQGADVWQTRAIQQSHLSTYALGHSEIAWIGCDPHKGRSEP